MASPSGPWIATLLDVWREGQRLSAVGPGPVEVHLEHGGALAAQLSAPAVAVDLGSGAGIPGLALAGLWPDSRWTLIDAAARRVRLLASAIEALGWADRVTALHGRAESLAHEEALRATADLVVARSFGPPAVTAECAVAFLVVGGTIVVTEPPTGEARWPPDPLGRLGLRPEASPPTDTVRIQRLRKIAPTPPDVPRRAGIPAKRPRFT